MTEATIQSPPSGARLLFAHRHSHSTSASPAHLRPPTDDFIALLSPLTALDSFRAPTGPLKACIDTATPSEKSFAIRAAVASKHIYEWLDELRSWSWAAKGGLGFQTTYSKRKQTQRGRPGSLVEPAPEQDNTIPEDTYIGSLLEADLAKRESRIDQIQAELDKLQIEEIKNHVLYNHIIPLSRPGTPASPTLERHFGMASLGSYTKMDDMTAVITATVVQALPNLSKLMRLMNAWSVRLTVLRRIPSWLSSVEDAESAIQTGWTTIQPDSDESPKLQATHSQTAQSSKLSRHDFEVMKLILEKKVTRAATGLDYMLDNLEGRDDTLPDEWLDRMEKVEHSYVGWVAAREKVLRDAEAAAEEEIRRRSALEQLAEDSAEDDLDDGDDTIRVNVRPGVVISVENADDPDRPLRSVEEADETSGSLIESDSDADDSSVSESPLGTRASAPKPSKANRTSPNTPPQLSRSVSLQLGAVPEHPEDDGEDSPQTPPTSVNGSTSQELGSPIILGDSNGDNDHMQRQISAILESLPSKIKLASQPKFMSHLNPPDLQLPHLKPKPAAANNGRSRSTMSSRASSRGPTPPFMLAPVPRSRHQQGNQDIKMYHLSRANGEAPIKLFIRCVGEHGERVMVRVGGGWADLGEYLKEYAIHHGRRSNHGSENRLEVRDIPRSASSMSQRPSASPPYRPRTPGNGATTRPVSAMGGRDTSPLFVKKKRAGSTATASPGGELLLGPRLPGTPVGSDSPGADPASCSSSNSAGGGGRSRSGSHMSWNEAGSAEETALTLGMAGPRSSRKEIPQESLEWVESIKEKVRAASVGAGPSPSTASGSASGKFGEMGKIGGTKRVFRKAT
ncbi:unnamed protein product [Discula destructiva]